MSRLDRKEMALIVDRLRRFVAGQTSGSYPQLADDLQNYSRQCEDVNRQLQECLQLYQQGYYLNAAAAAEPPESILLDCEQLEFQGADVLGSVAAVHGHAEPAIVQRDWVAALNEACEIKLKIEPDLCLLRQLTLASRPIPARLYKMRQIFERIPNHPFLEADIRLFERTWFQEAKMFCLKQPEELRQTLLEEVLEDLTSGRYLEKPPAALLETLRTQRREVLRSSLPQRAAELRELHERLGGRELLTQAEFWFHEGRLDQFQTSDMQRFVQLAEAWTTACTSCGQMPDSGEFGLAEPLDHAQRISRAEQILLQHQAAVDALLQDIRDNQCGIPRLQQRYQQAKAIRSLDQTVEKQFRQRVSWLRIRGILRIVLLLLAVLGVLGGCAAVAFMF